MRRSENNLPSRQDWQGSVLPWSRSDFLSPTSFFASPWQTMRRMQEDMDRIFGQFLGGPSEYGMPAPAGQEAGPWQWTPNVDISQTDKEWRIEADLPGVKQGDINAEIRDHYLILRAELRPEEAPQGQTATQPAAGQQQGQPQRQYQQRERRWGYFERVLTLPENADEEKVSSEFKDDVLTIHLPKMEPQAPQGRRIPIGAGQARGTTGQPGTTPSGSTTGTPAAAGAKGGETAS